MNHYCFFKMIQKQQYVLGCWDGDLMSMLGNYFPSIHPLLHKMFLSILFFQNIEVFQLVLEIQETQNLSLCQSLTEQAINKHQKIIIRS